MNREEFTEKLNDFHDRLNGVFDQLPNDTEQQEVVYRQALVDLQVMFEELQVASEELQQRDDSLIAAQEIIDAERQRYINLFQYAPDGYVVTNQYGIILEANQAAADLLGIPLLHLTGKPLPMYIDKSYKTRIMLQIHDTVSENAEGFIRIDEGEVLMRPRNKEKFWARLVLAIGEFDTINNPGVVNVLWKIHDIELIKQAQEALKRARDELELRVKERTQELEQTNEALKATMVELERRNKELQEFAFAASHDLQEPLRKISKFGELVMAHVDEEMDKESADYVRRMVNAAQRMEAMIAGLLEYARVSSQEQPFTQVDLNEVAKAVLSDLDLTWSRHGGEVNVQSLPTICANPVQMRQLLQNLISNATKFHRDSIPPHVQIWSEPLVKINPHRVAREGFEEANWIELYIQDNGIGFEEKYLERMLQPFERLHRPGEYEGMGMGLAICRKIVERHGGKITATSTLGNGSTFIITLPVKQEQC